MWPGLLKHFGSDDTLRALLTHDALTHDSPGCQDKVYGECGDGIVPGERVECCGKMACKPAQPGAPPVCLPNV